MPSTLIKEGHRKRDVCVRRACAPLYVCDTLMHATAQLTQVGPSRGPPNYMPREPSSKTAQRSRGGDVNNQMMPQRTPCTAPPTLFFSCAACAHSPKRGWYSKLRRMAVPTQYPTLFMILCCATYTLTLYNASDLFSFTSGSTRRAVGYPSFAVY